MIKFIKKKYKKEEIKKILNKYVSKWFFNKFKTLTEPQKLAIIPISKGKNVLISSPTGSGKTLTAFLFIISKLFDLALKNKLKDKVYCIYVSPLRALSNDIYKNLEIPLKEISEIAKKDGKEIKIRHAIRHSDVSSYEKSKMLKEVPHILITTPESLAIILNSKRFMEKMNVKYVIIDEIHSLFENKRGTHLSLSLERLNYYFNFQRIGLSATINPLKEVAKFLVGKRSCYIADASFSKKKEIKVLCPTKNVLKESDLYDLIAELVKTAKTTLIFTNTRSATERVTFHLKEKLKGKVENVDEKIESHHSSLSKEVRLKVEEKLKKGKLKVIVSSTSLELGIDIGYIDQVIQISSPKSVTRFLQRLGRAGHEVNKVSKGFLISLDRDDLVEVTVIGKKALKNSLEKARPIKNALDVLCQHLIGMALNKKWSIKEAFNLIKKAYPYFDLSFEDFENCLKYLSGYENLKEYKVYGKIWYKDGFFGRRGKYTGVIYNLNVGTIPNEVKIKVYDENYKRIGYIEEGFLENLVKGDRFVLSGRVYEFVKAIGNKVFVKSAFDKKPTIPSWFSEQLPLNYELAKEIREFREKLINMVKRGKSIIKFLMKNYNTDYNSAYNIEKYIKDEINFLKLKGLKYKKDSLFIEYYIDDDDRQNIIFQFLFGRKCNEALAKAISYKIGKKLKCSVANSVSDLGFVITLPRGKRTYFESINDIIKSEEIEDVLKKAIYNTQLFKRRFRHVASRAFMVLKNYKGHEIRVERQQINANRLIKVVKKIKDFPIMKETFREIFYDFMHVDEAKEVLENIEKGKFKEVTYQSEVPSPFSQGIYLVGLTDVVLMEDKLSLLRKFSKVYESGNS